MRKILGGVIAVLFLISFPLAHADRFTEWMDMWKKQEEARAIKYQKEVLYFDYEKINNKDPGFKTTDTTVYTKKVERLKYEKSNIVIIKQHYRVIN